MSTDQKATGPSSRWEVVLRAWKELDLPEEWRAEIFEGDIVLTRAGGRSG
ncbi:hypothetical protein [Nocardiopsis sp. FIRDI 009]|nr:hypothetical protein [Nocardiopsis sp. FIRDI 009]